MSDQLIALAIFIAVFAVAAWRNVNIGIVMFPVAGAVGLWMADMGLEDIIGEFPLSILVLLVGVTYFFGIAHTNGTIDWLIDVCLARAGDRKALLVIVFFLLTALVSAMGAPLGGLVMAPMGMGVAHKRGIDPMLMALSMGAGLSAGAFAPTSLFGIITWGTADSAGIHFSPLLLFAIAIGMNLVLLALAYGLFRRTPVRGTVIAAATSAGAHGSSLSSYGQSTLTVASGDHGTDAPDSVPTSRTLTWEQALTLILMAALVICVIVMSLEDLDPDIGVLGFCGGAILALVDPDAGKKAMTRIDWGSVLLVGGIITYVGVLTEMGVLDLIGEKAAQLGSPLAAAFLLCVAAGLISAFASTTGMLAALVPLALPMIADGNIP
ncbi:MAG: SLC13 family permease, partial [Brevibacterium linens]